MWWEATTLCFAADNTKKKLNVACQKIPIDLSLFAEQPGEGRKPVVTPQILLAAHRFLLAEVDPFKNLSDKVLLRLLKQDVVTALIVPESEQKSDRLLIYRKNKASDYFVLILEVSGYDEAPPLLSDPQLLVIAFVSVFLKFQSFDMATFRTHIAFCGWLENCQNS